MGSAGQREFIQAGLARTTAAFVLFSVFVPAAAPPPAEVAAVSAVARAYAVAALEGNLDAFAACLIESRRSRAQETLSGLGQRKAMLKGLKRAPLVVLTSASEAIVCSPPWRLGLLNAAWGDPNQQFTTKVSLYRAARAAAEGEEAREPWLVSVASPAKLGTVPGLYPHWRNKHPEGTMYVSPTAPRWLALPDWAAIETVRQVEQRLRTVWAETREVTAAVQGVCGGIEVFDGYFPASKEGRAELTRYWREYRQKKRDRLSPAEEMALTRRGLCGTDSTRRDSWRKEYLKAIGTSYLWGKSPQRSDAIELAVLASYHPDLAATAVYYGLSVLRPTVPEDVLERLVELALQHVNVGRILWGTKGVHEEMTAFLTPYLVHADPRVVERAASLELALRGELDYEAWTLEQTATRQRELLDDDTERLRAFLLKEDSGVRREALRAVRRHGLFRAFGSEFHEAFEACTRDGDPEVRELGTSFLAALQSNEQNRSAPALERLLRLAKDGEPEVRRVAATQLGSHFVCTRGRQEPRAIKALMALGHDPDRAVRHNAVYFGLSVVRDRSDTLVDQLIEMALSDSDRGSRGRIVWALRNCSRTRERLREAAASGDKRAADLLAELRGRQ